MLLLSFVVFSAESTVEQDQHPSFLFPSHYLTCSPAASLRLTAEVAGNTEELGSASLFLLSKQRRSSGEQSLNPSLSSLLPRSIWCLLVSMLCQHCI
ncbi:hypothetical protein Taro_038833 [Colocasia esculenta]|uniref:Uncharacterized protein n=1 Tax=Colocasia esculenta TaxID=4460 RepID=A0A843WDZ2_COLES|nr:hypothetical protein [Colocasia esculenta]